MADAIGVAGLALAIPGLISLLFEYGQWISERVKTFKNAKGVWIELGEFGWGLSQGELNVIILTAKSFYLEVGCDPGLKNSLELQIRKLASDVDATRIFLSGQSPGHFIKRAIFAISGEKRAKELNTALALDKQSLAQILTINDIRTRRVPDQILLTEKRFVHYEHSVYQPIESAPHLFVTRGDYRESPLEGPFHNTTVIIERSAIDEQVSEDILKEITAFVLHRLPEKVSLQSADVLLKGILPCLGYRMKPTPELIFAMPKGTQNPQMLQTLIASDQGVTRYPLDFRFKLARRLSEAVLRVHAAKLVHKSIRTNTILILQPTVQAGDDGSHHATGFGDVYLTNWRLLRDVAGPTSQSGGTQWTENLYRHPRRQGMQVEERYNIGHDIYSLGVCLLEIGLWDLLVCKESADNPPRVSDLFRAAADVEGFPDPEAELRAKLRRPNDIKNILLKLAGENLPQKMGLGYHNLVIACLTGLDEPSGFGANVDFEGMNQVEQGLAFKELVLSFFTEMSA